MVQEREYKVDCEAAKNKYLCFVTNHIEDVRRNNATIAYLNELNDISRCIITELKKGKLSLVPITTSFSKISLIKHVRESCNCEDAEVEKTIQQWIEAGLMYETNLGNIGMHMLF